MLGTRSDVVPFADLILCPYLPLPALQTRESYVEIQCMTPGSTPEPFAEQDGVALAAETGNPAAFKHVINHFQNTGSYSTST
jgi:hypothetical protein